MTSFRQTIRSFVALLLLVTVQSGSYAADSKGYGYALFDGKTLNGWKIENACEAEVKDGAILLKSGDGWLRSDHEFSDFVLHLEWKALKKTKYDAGIYVRTKVGGPKYPSNGHQINLLEGREGDITNIKEGRSAGLIKHGEWNVFDISVIGDRIATKINGKPAYDVGGVKNRTGHVGFQIEVPLGGQFLIRDIRIIEAGYSSLFTGKDLQGWKGAGKAADACWKVEDGNLMCTGEKGPWIRSDKEYGDFNFRFDYQVSDGGNSGVYVRVPENGLHHRKNEEEPAAGFEIQVLDDFAEKYAKLKPYQYCGSLYDICGASEHVGRPAGQWNTLEINCEGQYVTTRHNGIVIVDVTPESHPLINLRKLKGYLGLQNHSTVVKFRNLRIGPAFPAE